MQENENAMNFYSGYVLIVKLCFSKVLSFCIVSTLIFLLKPRLFLSSY